MPPSLFKNTSTGAWTDVSTYRTIWRFDRYGTTPREMVLVFETYPENIELFTGHHTDINNEGDLAVTFENYASDVGIFTGTFVDTSTSGDLDCTFETLGFYSQAGLHMDCTMEPWDCAFYYFIEGEDMDNCVFPFWEVEMFGSSDYIYMDCEFKEFEAEMWSSPGAQLVFEKWQFNATGTNGTMGVLDCTFRQFEMTGSAGGPTAMELEFEKLEFQAQGLTQLHGSLDLVFRLFQAELQGSTGNHADMDCAFLPMVVVMGSGDFIDPVGNMDCMFEAYRVDMSGSKNIEGNLAGSLGLYMEIEMTGYSDGPNNLDLVFEAPDIKMQDDGGEGGEDGQDCALADTLIYRR